MFCFFIRYGCNICMVRQKQCSMYFQRHASLRKGMLAVSLIAVAVKHIVFQQLLIYAMCRDMVLGSMLIRIFQIQYQGFPKTDPNQRQHYQIR